MTATARFLVQPGINSAAAFAARADGPVCESIFESLDSAPLGLVPLGSVEFCRAYALRHGVTLPDSDTYPERLRPFMGREIRLTTFGEVGADEFVKPVRTKLFTGLLKREALDYIKYGVSGPISDDEPVWACKAVEFVCEWRAYVLNGAVLGAAQYGEGYDLAAPLDDIKSMVDAYGRMGGYALDVGKLADGSVVVVEVNDGWALGYYPHGTCSRGDYLRLVDGAWPIMPGRVLYYTPVSSLGLPGLPSGVAKAVVAASIVLSGCCTTAYRYDGQRYYRADSCPWGERVVCDSATRLPDPATWTEGCR